MRGDIWTIQWTCFAKWSTQAVRVATQYAPAPCKFTMSSHLFATWRWCSGLTISSYLFARWHLFRHVGYLRHQHQVDLWPFDLESGIRVTCDVRYLCANFSLPRPLFSRVRPDVRDRQTDVRRHTDIRQTSDWSIAYCLRPMGAEP